MQMVKNAFIVLLSLWFALVIFMPKKELYYALEHKLDDYGIVLNEKEINENIFSLKIKDIDVYTEGIKMAHLDSIDFFTIIFYNTLDVSNVFIDSSLKSFVPLKIEKLDIVYNIINPLKVNIKTNGEFGKAVGYIDYNRTIYLDFIEIKNIKSFKKNLKKNSNGWYYESKF